MQISVSTYCQAVRAECIHNGSIRICDVKAVVDTEEFKKLVLADDASGAAPRLGLADREALSAMRRIAVAALHGIAHDHVDISKRKFAIVDGERITVYVDGVWIMDYETSTLCASGSVGLITTYANGYFGNITVLNGTYTHDPFYNV